MTVGELIVKLQQLDPELKVYYEERDRDGGTWDNDIEGLQVRPILDYADRELGLGVVVSEYR